MKYKERNQVVFNELEALFEKIEYGIVSVDFKLHESRITHIKVKGHEERTFKKPKQS